MPFLGRREVGNLREFRTDPWEGGNIFLVNQSWDEYFISNDSFWRFLDILAARKDPSGVSGEVLVDRAPQPPNFKCLSGYVVQVSHQMNDSTV